MLEANFNSSLKAGYFSYITLVEQGVIFSAVFDTFSEKKFIPKYVTNFSDIINESID